MFSLHDFRNALLSIDWALTAFFIVKLTPFEFVSGDILKNIGGIALFAVFIIAFELAGREFIWEIAGKHHRLGRQILVLIAMLFVLAGAFTLVA